MAFEVDLKPLYKETQRREHEIQRQEFRLGEMGTDRYMLFSLPFGGCVKHG